MTQPPSPPNAYGVYHVKTHLSELLERVARGEEITVLRHGEAVARLVPAARSSEARPRRKLGTLAGSGTLSAEQAFAPMTDEELAEWGL